LSGRTVVVTRAPHQAEELARLLRARGAVPLLYPCIDILPPADCGPLDAALRAAPAGAFDWLALTSVNTVHALVGRLQALALAPAIFTAMRVAAVGPATAEAGWNLLGLRAELVPDEFSASALARVLPIGERPRVLVPQSALAETDLSATLSHLGAEVTSVVAYQTGIGAGGADLPAALANANVAAITLTSASTATNLVKRLTTEGGDVASLSQVCLACIGPSTASAARQAGLQVVVVPDEHTLGGLVTALERYFQQAREEPYGDDAHPQ
jgi:uroporphyrinogen-III synthase